MNKQDNKIHFRKTLYFKMSLLILFLGVVFFGALLSVYGMSRIWFEDELAYHSDTLTEQVCRNVEVTLKELSEETAPLTATNERLGPILAQMGQEEKKEDAFLRSRIQYNLDELLNMNYDINWMAVITGKEEVFFNQPVARPSNFTPGKEQLLQLYQANRENLGKKPGNTVWLGSFNPDGIILMRSLFDSDSMKFCGCIIAEVRNTSIKKIFESVDHKKTGDFTLYDRNGGFLYSTYDSWWDMNPKDKEKETEEMQKRGEVLWTEYPISQGKLKLVHVVNLKEKNQRLSDLLRLVSGMGLAVFVAVILFLWMMFGKMAKNLKILLENLHRVSRGEFELEPTLFAKGDELDVLALNIMETSVQIKSLMEQVVKNEELQQQGRYALLEARYQELQAQVNPHFLFNILQSINGIAQLNGDMQVSRLICMLSKFFRGNIDRQHRSCELKEELEYVRNYLELYKEIYPGRLEIRWDVDRELLNAEVPTYILQPVAENSMVHGMEPMVGTCTVKISVYREGECLILTVWDSGNGIEPGKLEELKKGEGKSKRVGLKNVQNRIQIICGSAYGLSVDSEYHHYTEVKITLPLA